MAEVNEVCVFETEADQVRFVTQTNGDSIYIKNLKLSREQATSLAWLVNADNQAILRFRVKVKGT